MYKKKKILAITLARGGSKGVKEKNIKSICGKPLIFYTIREAQKSKYIDRYIVSTDSKKIQTISKKYGAEAPFLRPKYLSSDTASSVAPLKHTIKWTEKDEKIRYDIILELMCTNPLKKSKDIDSVIEKIINTKADSVIAVHRLEDHHPIRIKKIINDKIVNFCLKEKHETRRQDLKPKAYIRSGSIYALQRDHIMIENLRYGSKNSRPYILPESRAINVDNNIDFIVAAQIIKNEN